MASKNGMTTQGSPPRMRGKAGWRLRQCDAVGITPAYAGKRGTHGTGRTTGRDHPRVCGEKRGFHLNTLASTGSPPRVRGKGYDVVGRLGGVRITPACAGKSTQYFPACSCIWDHPRVCGEKLSTTSTDIHPAGSPSRVRGKADFPVRCREHSRITPACVGKRRKPCRRHAANRDHPRVCGEKATCCSMEQSR